MNASDIELLKLQKVLLNGNCNRLENVLNAYIDGRRDDMGLILDEVKTPVYKAIKSEYDQAFEQLREFNGKYAKNIRNA